MAMICISDKAAQATWFATGLGALTAAAMTLRRWGFDTAALDGVYYTVYPARTPSPVWPFIALAAVAAAVLTAGMRGCSEWSRKLLPAWLFLPLLFLPAGFLNLAAVLAVTAWCMMRCFGALQCGIPRKTGCFALLQGTQRQVGSFGGAVVKVRLPQLSPRLAALLAALASLAAAAWSFYLQSRAYGSLFLAYQDWGEYTECYLRLISGKLPLRAYLVQAGHFNFLPNVLMTAALRLWRAPETVFLISALLSGSLPFLVYLLGRACRLPRSAALSYAVAAVFNPVFLNQSLSLFYGFHPVLFQGPLILLFFICERWRCRAGMAAAILLSMLVQETAAVLWAGYALYLFSSGKCVRGIVWGAFCTAVFLLVSNAVIPFASNAAGNPQLFHYARLGSTLWEVALSPILRPRAVLAALMQYRNLCFAAALLLPAGIPALRSPKRLLVALPLLAGVLLQDSPDVKNPVMQYGFEISVIVLAASIAAAGELLHRRDEQGKQAFRAGIRTISAMTILCALCWGRLPVGLYNARPIFDRPEAAKLIGALRRFTEGKGRVLATKRLRLYFMFDRETAAPDGAMVPGDTAILDLDDILDPAEPFRRRLLSDPRAMPVFSTNFHGRQFAVWKIAPPGTPRPRLPFLLRRTPEEFAAWGKPLLQEDPAFEARIAPAQNGGVLLLRVNKKVAYDVIIDLEMLRDGKLSRIKSRFGSGVYPAWQARPGDICAVAIPGAFSETVRLRLLRVR